MGYSESFDLEIYKLVSLCPERKLKFKDKLYSSRYIMIIIQMALASRLELAGFLGIKYSLQILTNSIGSRCLCYTLNPKNHEFKAALGESKKDNQLKPSLESNETKVQRTIPGCSSDDSPVPSGNLDIILNDGDYTESFIKGWGPGGQAVNKSSNAVQLKHRATGIVVKCHDTRSLETNRKLARSRLLELLKQKYQPETSNLHIKREKLQRNQQQVEKRRLAKQEATVNDGDFDF